VLIGWEPLHREIARFGEDAVVAAYGMAFGLDVDIPLFIVQAVGCAVENAKIERGEQLHLREIGPGMAASGAVGIQGDDVAAHRAGFVFKFGYRK